MTWDKPVLTHNILPDHCQAMLKAAAQVKGAHARDEAIDNATSAIKSQLPKLFHPVEINDNES